MPSGIAGAQADDFLRNNHVMLMQLERAELLKPVMRAPPLAPRRKHQSTQQTHRQPTTLDQHV